MRIRHPGLWLGFASALLVVWFVWSDRGRVSPGPVSAAHAQEPSIAEQGCEQCHGRTGESMATACNGCHAAIGTQLAEHRGFHGALGPDRASAESCGRCHSEHHGREFELVSAASFALAGVADRQAYDHAPLEFRLNGRHAQLACRDCHAHADVAVLVKGDRRFLGLAQACESCHEDVHEGKLPDCSACHGQTRPFEQVANFSHTAAFPLAGSHAGLACASCHATGTDRAVEVLAATGTFAAASKSAPRDCADCHPTPHTTDFLSTIARTQGTAPGATCGECHRAEHASFAGEEPLMSREAHAATGFALDPPHADVACRACHDAPAAALADPSVAAFARFGASHPGRAPDDCRACHADPHDGQFDVGSRAGQGCLACHSRHGFRPPTFDVAQHAGTPFPLTGSHAAVACGECHVEKPARRSTSGEPSLARMFHGTSAACSSCHSDAHAGFFAQPWQRQNIPADEGCAHCHSSVTFDDTRAAQFDHARWTRMPLEGAHARARCEACHARTPEPDATGRSFGRAAPLDSTTPALCGACHADAHRGTFTESVPGRAAQSPAACSSCHSQESFDDLAQEFDHGRWTGFALDGAHALAACETCHPPSALADETGRRFGRAHVKASAASNDCRACHADAHQGAFDRAGQATSIEGRVGCLRCHTTESFAELRTPGFDHARWTGFALDGAHASIECASCHAPSAPRSPLEVRFAKAAGSDCASCHADPHVGQFARGGRTECAQCHSATASFRTLRFDHQRDSRFALDATHSNLACSACHVTQALPNGGTAVRYKPLGTVCGDCHDTRGNNPREGALRMRGSESSER